MVKSYKIIVSLVFCLVFLFAGCDDSMPGKEKSSSGVISGEISKPVVHSFPKKEEKTVNSNLKTNPLSKEAAPEPEPEKRVNTIEQEAESETNLHYDSKGKIDPFIPLIQEKPEGQPSPVIDDRPKRILTPLEKIDIGQIRLVAVILMKNKQIAMVEEASGKGYEVGIGTYIGKNQGRVSEIKKNSIVIKELVRDFKGKLKEHVQEIKLNKMDNEE